ncbi:hypothetical protein [Trinickia mobilis]|uniref:hypothetical protein n=1 Tax=Trinickia mobilis TaxID=2816356 RepID=UPI001A901810|nr:hypothetical protein [Trinickia mobilis]
MTHGQPVCGEICDAPPPEVVTALSDLYILSNAAAQRGAYGLEVRDTQWRALARGTQDAKRVLDRQLSACETQAIGLLRRLTSMCEGILECYTASRECPSAIWREVGRLGRDAYECIDLIARRQRGTDA